MDAEIIKNYKFRDEIKYTEQDINALKSQVFNFFNE